MAKKRYEYASLTFKWEDVEDLDGFGREGWRAIHIHPTGEGGMFALMERETEDAPATSRDR